MNTLLIKQLYHEICELPLPFMSGKEVNSIDLMLLDADIAGFASRAEQITQFNREDKVSLLECQKELEIIFPYLTKMETSYFSKHRLICIEMTKALKPLR